MMVRSGRAIEDGLNFPTFVHCRFAVDVTRPLHAFRIDGFIPLYAKGFRHPKF
jgi:hypothetical protein